jgi:hypothetical protein
MKRCALVVVVVSSCSPSETESKSSPELPSHRKIFGNNENGSDAKAGEELNEYLRKTNQADRLGTDFIE